MKHTREQQATSVVRAPTPNLVIVDIAHYPMRSRIKQCEDSARERIRQGFREDASLLLAEVVEDKTMSLRAWLKRLRHQPDAMPVQAGEQRGFYGKETLVDVHATQPIPLAEILG